MTSSILSFIIQYIQIYQNNINTQYNTDNQYNVKVREDEDIMNIKKMVKLANRMFDLFTGCCLSMATVEQEHQLDIYRFISI